MYDGTFLDPYVFLPSVYRRPPKTQQCSRVVVVTVRWRTDADINMRPQYIRHLDNYNSGPGLLSTVLHT